MGSVIASVLWPETARPNEPAPPRTAQQLGAFYTPSAAASYMARWAVRSGRERILEPSMGDGQFLRAVEGRADQAGFDGIEVWGVEIDRETYRATVGGGVVAPERAFNDDFLRVNPFPIDVVIGNPPYVRLRNLPKLEAEQARLSASQSLGVPMDPAGSVWLPFVTHATRFLEPGGRLAFVLPYDLTYVRYARPLWRFLGRHFGSLRLARVFQRLFPDILQDVVLLLADERGATTTTVMFECYEKPSDLLRAEPSSQATIGLERITSDGRPFMEAVLPAELRDLLEGRLAEATQPMGDYVTWNIGYVAGDKGFFHPSTETIKDHGISESSLVPAFPSGRRVTRRGLRTSQIQPGAIQRLFLPPLAEDALTDGDRSYIEAGRDREVHRRYKCRIRTPWYVTPGVKRPDLIMPVFADQLVMLVNDGGYAVSNSMLAGYLRTGSTDEVVAAWYSSLTLLQIELNVHSLGGGVLVLVPREAAAIRTPIGRTTADLTIVDQHLRDGRVQVAYQSGDVATIEGLLNLGPTQVDLIREGVALLQRWRRGAGGNSAEAR